MASITALGFDIFSRYDGSGVDRARRDLNDLNSEIERNQRNLNAMASGFNPVLTAAVALGPALVQLGAGAAAVAGGFVAATAAAGAAGGVWGVAALAAARMTDSAMTAAQNLQKQKDVLATLTPGTKAYSDQLIKVKEAQGELNAEMSKLGPAQQQYVTNVMAMQSAWQGFIRDTSASTLGPVNTVIQTIAAHIRDLIPIVTAVGGVAQGVANDFKAWADNGGIQRFVALLQTYGVPALTAMVGIARNVISVLSSGFQAFLPLGMQVIAMIADGAAKLKGWADGGGFQRFIQMVQANGPQLKEFFQALGGALKTLGESLVGLGPLSLQLATALLQIVAACPPPVIMALVVAFTAWKAAMLGMMIVNALAQGFRLLAMAVGVARVAFMLLNLVFVATPIGWIALAIAGLIAGIVLLATKTQFFQTLWHIYWTICKTIALTVWGILKAAWEALSSAFITVWQAVSGALTTAWGYVWGFIRDFAHGVWVSLQQAWQVLCAIFGPIFQAAMTVFQAIWNAVWTVVKTVAEGVWNGLQAAWNLFIGIFGPIFQVAIAVFQTIWNAVWTAVKTVAEGVWNGLKAAWNLFVSIFGPIFQAAITAFQAIWNAIWTAVKTVAEAIWNALKAVWNAFVNDGILGVWRVVSAALQAAWSAIWTAIQAVASAIWAALQAAWNAVCSAFTTIWNAVSSALTAAWNAVWNALSAAGQAIWNAIQAAWNAVCTAFTTIWNTVSSALTAAWNAFWNALQAAGQAIWNAMQAAWNAFLTAVQTVWNAVSSAISAAWNAFWTAVQTVATTIWNALAAFFTAAWNTFQNAINTMMEWIKAAWNAAWSWIRDTATTIWNAIVAFFTGAWAAFQSAINAFLEWIKNLWNTVWTWIKDTAVAIWQAVVGFVNSVLIEPMKQALSAVSDWIRTTFWNPIHDFFTKTVPDAFGKAVEFIKAAWEKVKEIVRAPIEAVVDVVYNKGIVKIWNWVSGLFGGPKLEEWHVPQFERGGRVGGKGTARSDDNLVRVGAGEHIWTGREVQAAGGHAAMYRMRAEALGKRRATQGGYEGGYARFADGGGVGSVTVGGVPTGKPIEKPATGVVIPAVLNGIEDALGALKNLALGAVYGAVKPLVDMARNTAKGVVEGIVPGEGTGLEKTATGVIDKIADTFLEWIKAHDTPPNNGKYVPFRPWRAGDEQRVNWHGVTINKRTAEMMDKAEKLFGQAVSAFQGSYSTSVGASAGTHAGGGAIDVGPAVDPLVGAMRGSGFAAWRRTPAEGFSPHIHGIAIGDAELSPEASQQVTAFLAGKNGLADNGPDTYSGPVPGLSGNGVGKEYAQSRLSAFGWGSDQWAPLEALWTRESNWNPTATNPSSGAYGIPQALPKEKMASAGADYMTNPNTQIDWGMGYIKSTYGTPAAANSFQMAHNGYRLGTSGALRGWHLVGEVGPEWVKFRGGEKVLPSGTVPKSGGGGDTITISDRAIVIEIGSITPETLPAVERDLIPKLRLAVQAGVGKKVI